MASKCRAIRSNHAGQNAQQLERTSADDREVIDLACTDRVFPGAGLCLQLAWAGSDGDRFSWLAHLHGDVDTLGTTRLDYEIGLHRGFEALEFGF